MTAPVTLQEHLAAVAAGTELRIGVTASALWDVPAMQDFRAAIATDPTLKQHAETMLASFDQRVLMRDHVTRWNKAALEAALEDTP